MIRPLFVLLLAAACAQPAAPADVRGLSRARGEGPYLEGSVETFRLDADEGAAFNLTWSASAGTLNASGDEVTWKLPPEGVATLSLDYRTAQGEPRTQEWSFQIYSPEGNAQHASQALLAAPVVLLDGGTATTGSFCTLEYDSASNIHLAYREDDHPSLYYGKWNGTTWAIELVDGMGFNTGGLVSTRFSMVLDPANVPHLAYYLEGKGLYYATRQGTGWLREKVDSAALPPYDTRASIALDPSNANRPVIVYTASSAGQRIAIAVRTGPGAWTVTLQDLSPFYTAEALQGDLLIDAAGAMYIPWFSQQVTQVTGTSTVNGSVTLPGTNSTWYNAAFGATGKAVLRMRDSVDELTIAAPYTASTIGQSRIEVTGASVGDLAWRSKPYALHLHGSNLELVTTDANNYWTYTQLGVASSTAQPAIAVSAAGTVSICYQASNRIMFQ